MPCPESLMWYVLLLTQAFHALIRLSALPSHTKQPLLPFEQTEIDSCILEHLSPFLFYFTNFIMLAIDISTLIPLISFPSFDNRMVVVFGLTILEMAILSMIWTRCKAVEQNRAVKIAQKKLALQKKAVTSRA